MNRPSNRAAIAASGRTARATARQAELFDAIVVLFLAEGFADTTLDQLSARLRCSKSTLYALAASREQLIRAAVVHFFRRAAAHVEDRIAGLDAGTGRVGAYLDGVARELAPAEPSFYADVTAFGPAREIYERNTVLAAQRVGELIDEGISAGAYRRVDPVLAADLISAAMTRIADGGVGRATGRDDAAAFRALADLIMDGLRA